MAGKNSSAKKNETKGNNNSKGGKSHRSNEQVNSTAEYFGICSTVMRVFLAILVIAMLIYLIVNLIQCKNSPHCDFFDWLIRLMCMVVLLGGLLGVYLEEFCTIFNLALNLLFWALYLLIAGHVGGGLLALFTAFTAFIYAYMIWKSGLPISGAACCCCCLCIRP